MLCISCGHIALAYGGSSGAEIVYQWEDTKLYEIESMYLVEADKKGSTIVECLDGEVFHKYVANLKTQNMTGNYTFTNSEKVLNFIYEMPKGSMFVKLTDHVIQILPFYEDVRTWRTYYLPEGVDWEYLETILERV